MIQVLSLALSACLQVTSRPACEIVERTPLGDTDSTPVGTPAELLAVVERDGIVDARNRNDTVVEAYLRLARASGRAEWIDHEPTSIETRRFGLGRSTLGLAVDCPDVLVVPLEGRVEVGSEGIEVVGVGEAIEPLDARFDPVIRVDVTGAFADARFPDPDPDPADYEERTTFIVFDHDLATGEMVSGSAGWQGTREQGESIRTSWDYQVRFGDFR